MELGWGFCGHGNERTTGERVTKGQPRAGAVKVVGDTDTAAGDAAGSACLCRLLAIGVPHLVLGLGANLLLLSTTTEFHN